MTIDDDYFKSKEFYDKLASYEQCVAKNLTPFMDANDLTDIANYYNINGKPMQASAAIDLALEIYPNATQPLIFKAKEALGINDVELAERYISEITDQDEEDVDLLYLKADILIAKGQTDNADMFLQQYVDSFDDEQRKDYIIDVAYSWNEHQDYDRAYTWAQMLKDKNDIDAQELLAKIYLGMQRFDESIALFEQVIDKNPFSANLWFSLASVYVLSNNSAEALKCIDFALAIEPNHPDCLQMKGSVLMKEKEYAKALEFYTRYMECVPDDMSVYSNMAICHQCLGNTDEAYKIANEILQNDSDDDASFNACEVLTFVELMRNNPEGAMKWAVHSESYCFRYSETMALIAHIKLAEGHLGEALYKYLDSLSFTEDHDSVISRMIASLYDTGYSNLGDLAAKLYGKDWENDTLDGQPSDMTAEEIINYLIKGYNAFLNLGKEKQ